jgi:RNA polymerase sigma-70 factor (ECF subfamily)
VQEALRSDSVSDDEIFAGLYPSLRRFAATIRPPEVDPDDLVQEALVRVLANRSLAEIDHPGAFLRTTMLRLVANERRSLGRRRRAFTRAVADDAEAPTYPSDLDELRRLDPEDRAVLYLVVVERASYAEVAEILSCNEATARSRKLRALRKLRSTMSFDTEEVNDG